MSNVPSRSRSLRKPAENGTRNGRAPAEESHESNVRLSEPKSVDRSSHSPSRLPIKPATRNITSTSARPPSATSSTASNASIRVPPPRANIGKPTTGGLQRSSSNRQSSTSQSTEPVKQDRSRPPLTTSRHLRTPSASSFSSTTRAPSHSRAKSTSTTLSSSAVQRPPTKGPEELVSQIAHAEPQFRRPAFSTLQQHFSPAKNLAPKPHPASFLAPPTPSKLPSNIAISAETAKLQNELLQLHLLHKDFSRVENEWKKSAKRKLGARFQSVVDRNEDLVDLEVEEVGKVNAAAFRKLQDLGSPGWGLQEHVLLLDEVITGVWNLGESGGKYARVVRKFERWLSRCQNVMEVREHDDGVEHDDIVFLEELDMGWMDDCLFLGRKLEIWRNQLEDIGSPDPGSSLAAVVDGCKSLVRGMLMGLGVMGQIERDAMSVEVDWIKSMNDDVLEDDTNIPATAVWRSLH